MPQFRSSIGGRVAAPGPGDFPQATGADVGAAIGQGLAALGEAGQEVVAQRRRQTAAILEKQRRRQEADDELAAGTRIATENSNAALRREDIKNSSASGSEYIQRILEDHDEMAAAILRDFEGNPRQVAFTQNQLALDREALATGSIVDAAKINTTIRENSLGEIRDAGTNQIRVEPFAFSSILDTYREGIAGVQMPPDDKAVLLREAEEFFAEAHVMGLFARFGKDVALSRLKSEEIRDLISPKKSTTIEVGIESAEKAKLKQAEAEEQAIITAAQDAFVQEIGTLFDSEQPPDIDGITARIFASPLPPIGLGSKLQMVEVLESEVQGITAEHNVRRFGRLMDRVLARDLTDANELLQPLIDHRISRGDFTLLKSLIDEPQEEIVKQFLAGTKAQITQSTALFPDPEGDLQFYKFTQELFSRLKRGKQEGKLSTDLLDPSPGNKDYIGDVLMSGFRRTDDDKFESFITGALGGPARGGVPQSRKGESIPEYQRRVGAGAQEFEDD